jgi:hypothetical protein
VIFKNLLSQKIKFRPPSLAYNLLTKKLNTKPLHIMKKIIYILLFAFICTVTITSCTEEEVTPTNNELNGGGGAVDPK